MEKIEYMIVHVGEHQRSKEKDIVAVSLEPTEGFNVDCTPTMMIEQGGDLPPEIRQLIQVMERASHSGNRRPTDERNIVILKPKLEFIQLGWKYGDLIEVSFEKIKEAKDVKPREETI